jgi:hypothetical protein
MVESPEITGVGGKVGGFFDNGGFRVPVLPDQLHSMTTSSVMSPSLLGRRVYFARWSGASQ